jgi:hypothetical protein
LALCLYIQKFRSRQPGLSPKADRNCHPQFRLLGTVIWDFGLALKLFRIKSERHKLPAPFSRGIAEPLDTDAAGHAIYGCFDKIGGEEG